MSALQRSALSARIAKLPQLPPGIAPTVAPQSNYDDCEDDVEEDETDGLGALPSMAPSNQSNRPNRSLKRTKPHDSELTPISAASYFSQAVEVAVPPAQLTFRVYYTPPKLSGTKGTVMVCHHGAGFSALSFACFAKEVENLSHGECGVLALDAREHGRTESTAAAEEMDLSVERLCVDVVELIKTIFPTPSESPTLLLVGHSMGGSVIVRASGALLAAKYKLAGVAVLDVVEGFTLDALPHMHNLLDSRPDGFDSQEEAIQWHVSTNTIRNPLSARISVPPIITPSGTAWRWRTPLRSTAPYWANWFTGLSKTFLSARTARLLVLAGTDRLDKELMIGQMQGKFQLVVIPNVGHMVHEDDPTRLAEILVEFWKRNDRVVAGVKKVGES
ncbi:protein phosphatase methylesterase [Gautieria morchelliformis]|nr:protein phosphatase methylesterase [Gautieria morchelliformis]